MQQYDCEQSGRRLTELVWKLRELVDVFTGVSAVGNAEAEVKVEVLEEPTLEVVSLDHPKAVDGPVAHRELHTGVGHTNSTEVRNTELNGHQAQNGSGSVHSRCTNCAQLEEGRGELVPHKTSRAGVHISALLLPLNRTWRRNPTSTQRQSGQMLE